MTQTTTAKRSASARRAAWPALCASALVFANVAVLRMLAMDRALLERGVRTSAQVCARARGRGATHGIEGRPAIYYRFQVAGRHYLGQATVSGAEFRKLRMGTVVSVVYLPSDPATNALGEQLNGRALATRFWTLMGFDLIVLVAVVALGCVRARRGRGVPPPVPRVDPPLGGC